MPDVQTLTDAIVQMVKTTICGTDLHILKGDVPTCAPGRVPGHEGVGVVQKSGPGVTVFHEGDSVLISCISARGPLRILPPGHVLPLQDGRLDSRQSDRWNISRIRAHPACGHQPLPHAW